MVLGVDGTGSVPVAAGGGVCAEVEEDGLSGRTLTNTWIISTTLLNRSNRLMNTL